MTAAAGDAHKYPVWGYHFRVTFPVLDADGDPISVGGLDAECSLDAQAFSDCTNESVQIATNSGMYYLDVDGTETRAKTVAILAQNAGTGTGAKATPITLYPIRLPQLEAGTAQAGDSTTITLAAGASAEDDFYNGLFIGITNDSPAGVQYQLRRIYDYNGTTKVADIDSDWGFNPSSASTYEILIPEGYSTVAWGGIKTGTATNRGLTALPDAAAEAAGGLYTRGTGAGQINQPANGSVDANAVSAIAAFFQDFFTVDSTEVSGGEVSGSVVLEVAKVVWDRLLSGATHNINTSAGKRLRQTQENLGYEEGSIWIDTVNGTAGAIDFENGTAGNPVDNIADANTLAASLGIAKFHIAPASSLDFNVPGADQTNQVFMGERWTLALGGRSVSGSSFFGADVSGIGTGATEPHFDHCHLGAVTLPPSDLEGCVLEGTFTIGTAGNFFFEDCKSGVAGTSTPILDFGSALNSSDVNFRGYSGGIEIQNMGAGTGTYNMSLEGFGQLVVNANCSATSSIAIRGHFTVTGDATAITAITFSNLAMFDHNAIIDAFTTQLAGITVLANWLRMLYRSDFNDATALAEINSGGGDYNETTDANEALAVTIAALNNLSSADVIAALEDSGLALVTTTISGVPTSQTQFILAAGSADDDAYIGCLIIIEDVSTAAQKAVGLIQSYTGSTKEVILVADPAVFTIADTDKVSILPRPQQYISFGTIVRGAAEAGTLSTTKMSTDLTEVTNDHYNGRVLLWTSGVLKNQATDITDYVGTNGVLTFTAVTEAPSAGDTFEIV